MKFATSWAPANISLFFGIQRGETAQTTGSVGAGFTVEEGVTSRIMKDKKTIIFFNCQKINFPTVSFVVKKLISQPVRVELTSSLPLGAGFGLSGASALATAYSLNKLFKLKKPPLELAKLAHIAEVENGTGLGDVINQYYGGLLIKQDPSYLFIAKKVGVKKKTVYWKHFSGLSTKTVIEDKKRQKKINKVAERILENMQNPSFTYLLQLGKEFSKESGLLKDKEVRRTITQIEKKGGYASMILLGNAVVSTIPFEGAKPLQVTRKNAL